ncbi:MAG: hypothetical protein ACTSR8_02850 [Promethearchaeota archaeon]
MSYDKSRVLNTINAKELKEICRDHDLKGYSSLNKGKLIDFIIDNLPDEQLDKVLKEKGMIPKDVVSDEDILKSMNKKRAIDDRDYLEHLLIYLNKQKLMQICKQYFIEGCSKFTKADLIQHILDSLSEEEQRRILYEKELEIIGDGINTALKKIKGEDRERVSGINIVNEEDHEIELDFKGFSWEIKSFLCINSGNINNPERDCDCRIGAANGFCTHFWVGFIFSYKQGWFTINDWTLTKLPDNFEEMVESIKLEEVSTDQGEMEIIDENAEDSELYTFSGNAITIYEGEVEDIQEKTQIFQEYETTYYLVKLKDVKIGPRVKKKSDFREEDVKDVNSINIRISQKIKDDTNLEIGDKVLTINGKLERDDFLRMYIVKNIRKVEKA